MTDDLSNYYPTELMDARSLFKLSWRYGWLGLTLTWPCMVVLAICFTLPLYLSFISGVWVTVYQLILALIVYYNYCFLALLVDARLKRLTTPFRPLFYQFCRKLIPLFIIFVLVLIPLCLLFYGTHYYSETLHDHQVYLLVFAAFLMVLYVNAMIAFPTLILHEVSFYRALIVGSKLCNHRIYRVIVLYVFFVFITTLVLPTSAHIHWLKGYFLTLPFNFVVLSVLLSVAVTYWLFIFNDLKLRMPSLIDD